MMLKRHLFILRPTNELQDIKEEKGLLGMEMEDQESITNVDGEHIGRWWRKWLRFA